MKNPLKDFDPKSGNAILLYLSFFKLILLLIFAGNYGLFRDEYYYIECSKHLAWGYVDQPPLSVFILFISRSLFGESLIAIRITAYIAGSATVFVSGLIARQLGGGKFAQALTAAAVIFCGVILGTGSYFSMNAFDILLSALMFYHLIKLLKTGNKKLWLITGLIFGIGLMNKLTFLFLGFGLAAGLILTKNRKYFLSKELWLGTSIAFIIFLPNITWQVTNGFPTLEFIQRASQFKNAPMDPAAFFLGSLLELNPSSSILFLAAFYFLFFNNEGKKFILIAIMYAAVILVFILNNGKPYYMGVLYPVILAAGAVGIDYLIERYLKNWARTVLLVVFLMPGYLFALPFAIPVFDENTFIKYSEVTGIKPMSGERSELGLLPQFFADRFGWEEMVQKAAVAYNKLSDEEKKNVLIFGQNYGEASAVNYYRNKYGLPQAISSHNNYWIWGIPKYFNCEVLIIIGSNLEDNGEYFEDVKLAATHYNKYGMPYENVDIFICRKPKVNLKEVWHRIKNFI